MTIAKTRSPGLPGRAGRNNTEISGKNALRTFYGYPVIPGLPGLNPGKFFLHLGASEKMEIRMIIANKCSSVLCVRTVHKRDSKILGISGNTGFRIFRTTRLSDDLCVRVSVRICPHSGKYFLFFMKSGTEACSTPSTSSGRKHACSPHPHETK